MTTVMTGKQKARPRDTFLDVPWESRLDAMSAGAKYDKATKRYVYSGGSLPKELSAMASIDYSYERWHEDIHNGWKLKPNFMPVFDLRDYQKSGVAKIFQTAKKGLRGFILADETGLGKTLTSLYGAYAYYHLNPDKRVNGRMKLLVVTTKTAIPHWVNVINRTRLANNLDIMVINYESMKRLLDPPASAKKAKRKKTADRLHAREGNPNIHWDIIISDESHKLKNDSQRRSSFERIARYGDSHGKAPFVIWASATIGQNPVELAYLNPLISQMRGLKVSTVKGWEEFLSSGKFSYSKGKSGLLWVKVHSSDTPSVAATKNAQRRRDLKLIRSILFSPDAPSIRRSPEDIAGFPKIQRIATPVKMSTTDYISYLASWSEFVMERQLGLRTKNPVGALAAQTRLRQKVSVIKVGVSVDAIKDFVETGHQVLVSVLYAESARRIFEALSKAGVKAVAINGSLDSNEREKNRVAFQMGDAQVVLFSVTDAISLHEQEQMADGRFASSNPRVTIVHDIRYSSIESIQVEGRGHRDGKAANVYYHFLMGSIEQSILPVMFQRISDTKDLSGDSEGDVIAIRNLYDKAMSQVA